MTKFEEIAEKTGYVHSECSCTQCANMCKTPCLGTPEDILKIAEAGYSDRLTLCGWGVGMLAGVYPGFIDMIQAKVEDNGWCTFYKDGLCELHSLGLKPTEGQLAHHSQAENEVDDNNWLTWLVAKEWLNMENYNVVLEIMRKMDLLKQSEE